MFADLMDTGIQPARFNIQNIPEITFPERLRSEIEGLLEAEEKGIIIVNEKTTVVQTIEQYVFFPNQWFYLASLCLDYAAALMPYGEFFDSKIRFDKDVKAAISAKDISAPVLVSILPDPTDRDRMIRYVNGGTDKDFRPGKSLLNGANGEKTRSVKDIFGSCMLKKLAVPDASSGYLGTLIYDLAKHPSLFKSVCDEVKQQVAEFKRTAGSDGFGKKISLPSTWNQAARIIVDKAYETDKFQSLFALLDVKQDSIKIKTKLLKGFEDYPNLLPYLFKLPSSEVYNNRDRVYVDFEYVIGFRGTDYKCRLTNQWFGPDVELGKSGGNYFSALVSAINMCYSGQFSIRKESDDSYSIVERTIFSLDVLPQEFQAGFARRFITSLLAKPFVILTGNSGTGKTRIAKRFAEYLEIEDKNGEKNWLIVPIGADWTDNTKILGFYNPLTKEYVETGILKLIERANANPTIPYFLILDEMNLSHVERYFSDFLSHMEIPDDSFVLDHYGSGKLAYPKNLFVVGTVNIDETTYMFSPKVLDRANVLEFKPEKDEVLNLLYSSKHSAKIVSAPNGVAESFLELAMEIRDGKCNLNTGHGNGPSIAEVESVFKEVYEIVEAGGFEFAYRTVREIRQYVSAAFELVCQDNTFDVLESIDEQLMQKVLPKIHGNRKEIGSILDELEKVCTRQNLEMPLSAKKIGQMKTKLNNVQYASFI